MSRNNNGTEFLFWLVVIVCGVAAFWVYFQVKSFADWAGLSWRGAFLMLLGSFLFIGGAFTCWIKGWNRAIPWLLPATFWFFVPGLNDKAHGVSPLGAAAFRTRDNDYYPWNEPAWYGNGWWQIGMFIGLIALAYGVYKLLDDGY